MRRISTGLFVLGALLISGCGDDDDDATADEEATDVTAEADADTDGDTAEGSGDTEGSAAAGQVTVGDQTYQFDPSIQCDVFPGGVVSIAGTAVSDPDVEIVFDVFDPGGDPELAVTTPDTEWRAMGGEVDAVIDGETVSGTATVSDGATTSQAAFEFRC